MSVNKVTYGYAIKPKPEKLIPLLDEIPNNAVSNFGILNQRLCQRLKHFLQLSDDKDIVLCSSGHTALMAAYSVANTKSLLMPAYTFHSTISAATLQGIGIEVTDVDLHSGCLEPRQIVDYLDKSKELIDGIVTVCALSNIPDLANIELLARQYNKKLIIDGAASFGTPGIYNYGDFFCLSFHGTKTFPIGEGGAVICSKTDAIKIKQYINFGFDSTRTPTMEGLNAKLSDYSAAIGLAIFDDVVNEIDYKYNLARCYRSQLPYFSRTTSNNHTIYQAFPLTMPSAQMADDILANLEKNGIEAKHYYNPTFSKPISDELSKRSVCIPCHSGITLSVANTIVDIIKDSIRNE